MTEQQIQIPGPVMANWREAHFFYARAGRAEADRPALDEQIAQVEQHLRTLREAHAARGREAYDARQNGDLHRWMVEQWCELHQVPVPAPPEDITLRPTEALPAAGQAAGYDRPPVWQEPPATQPDPLGDLPFNMRDGDPQALLAVDALARPEPDRGHGGEPQAGDPPDQGGFHPGSPEQGGEA